MKQGDVWIIDFPDGAGHEFRKQRPAILIQSTAQIKKTNIYTIVPLTSNLQNKTDDDILVVSNEKNNLYKDSIAKMHHIQTFDASRFLKHVGAVDGAIMQKIKEYIAEHFGL